MERKDQVTLLQIIMQAIIGRVGINPCPYCGGRSIMTTTREHREHGDVLVMMCRDCEAIGPIAHDTDRVLKRWNRRVK